MEPSPPRPPLPPFEIPYIPSTSVDLGRLAGPSTGITPFTVDGPTSVPEKEGERGSPAVELLVQHKADLTISDRPRTPYTQIDPPSPMLDTKNPKPNGSGFDSPPRLSPLGN
jgi:hypothetical protein